MTIFKFTVVAENRETAKRDFAEHFVAADNYDKALAYIREMLDAAGWEVIDASGKEVWLHDIRRKEDRT